LNGIINFEEKFKEEVLLFFNKAICAQDLSEFSSLPRWIKQHGRYGDSDSGCKNRCMEDE
jgi:hypothetical protein